MEAVNFLHISVAIFTDIHTGVTHPASRLMNTSHEYMRALACHLVSPLIVSPDDIRKS